MVVQLLYSAGPRGAECALSLAERYDDHRTRIKHALLLQRTTGSDDGMLVHDEKRVRSDGSGGHGMFLLHLCDAYYDLAKEEDTKAAKLDWQQKLLDRLGSLAEAGLDLAENFLSRHESVRWLYALQQAEQGDSNLERLPSLVPKLELLEKVCACTA